MEWNELIGYMRQHRYAVAATVGSDGRPQAAVVGIAITAEGEVIFDTLMDSRKAANLRRNPSIAFTIGSVEANAAATLQYEGVASFVQGDEVDAVQAQYFAVFPDGRARAESPGLVYVRVQPVWLRHSDFTTDPPTIQVIDVHPDRLADGAAHRRAST